MPLSNEQITRLLKLIATSSADELDCDGCFGKMAQFAEIQLAQRDIPDALEAVRTHLEQCHCCQDEFEALLAGLKALEEN